MRNKSDLFRVNVLQQFDRAWTELFSGPVHLDTLLSRQPKQFKPWIAKLLHPILARPVTMCRALDVPLYQHRSPFLMKYVNLKDWQTARQLASVLYDRIKKKENWDRSVPGWHAGDYPDIILEEFDSLTVALQDRSGMKSNREVLGVLSEYAPMSLRVSRRFPLEDVKTRLIQELQEVHEQDITRLRNSLSRKERRDDRFLEIRRNERFDKRMDKKIRKKVLVSEEDDINNIEDDSYEQENEEIEENEEISIRQYVAPEILFSKINPNNLVLPNGHAPVLRTKLFQEGAFEVQDEASCLMTNFACFPTEFYPLLSSQPNTANPVEKYVKLMHSGVPPKALDNSNPITTFGKWKGAYPATSFADNGGVPELPSNPAAITVVDACAGAGGKTLGFADNLLGRGRVYAYDVSETKLLNLKKRQLRAGLNNIQRTVIPRPVQDEKLASSAGLPDILSKFKSRADVVLVDAPCSGWGVLRRNPDLKWRIGDVDTFNSVVNLPTLQLSLLESYCPLVKPGGRLVYGVCTLRSSETIDVVSEFLNKHPEFDAMGGGFVGPISHSADAFFMMAAHKKDKAAMALMRSELRKIKSNTKESATEKSTL